MNPYKICFVSSEVVPFAKTGGLADVAGSLPIALKELEQDTRVMMTKYKSINERKFVLREVIRLKEVKFNLGTQTLVADGKTAFLPNSKVHVYFLHIPEYFDRKDLYVDSNTGKDFKDNAERFAAFCKSVLETLKLLYWQPDIIHCNDWQTALIPFYLKTIYKDDEFFKNTKTVLTIHNLAYQGNFPKEKAKKVDVASRYLQKNAEFEFYGHLNLLRGGIHFADVLNTVSEKYANEIMTDPEYGFGFEKLLLSRKSDLFGILNGVDYSSWHPATDSNIPQNYDENSLQKKSQNKKILCSEYNLEFNPEIPLIGIISRLVDQKGFDLIADAAEELLSMDLQMIILGTGDPKYHRLLEKLAKKYPKNLAVVLRYDNKLAHLIEAGSDIFLMPSKYEPCGLNQMYSLKYGTVPIVRETGGLADSIKKYNPDKGEGTGFVFTKYTKDALLNAVSDAVEIYANKDIWKSIQIRGMKEDFSWDKAAQKYLELYQFALKK